MPKTTSKKGKKKVAIFDIDGTIFRSSLLIEVTEVLIEEGIFPVSAKRGYAKSFSKWLDRRGSYDDYLWDVIHMFEKHIRGVHYRNFLRVAEKAVGFHKNRVYRYTRDLVRELRKQGFYLLAISKSPKGVVEGFAKELGFHKVYGMLYETDTKGRYTGGLIHFDLISDKAKLLARAVEKENLTLRGSVGVGDTESDIAFLELVSRPIAFNPNSALFRHARRKKWNIVVERKDVVYEI